MLCPLMQTDCVKAKCAWWDHGDNACAILGLKMEMIRLQEALEKPRHTPKDRQAETIAPLVVATVKQVEARQPIQHHKEVVSEPAPNNTQHQASEIPPKIAW